MLAVNFFNYVILKKACYVFLPNSRREEVTKERLGLKRFGKHPYIGSGECCFHFSSAVVANEMPMSSIF